MFPVYSAWLNEDFSYRDSLFFKTGKSGKLIASALAAERRASSAQWECRSLRAAVNLVVPLEPGKHQTGFDLLGSRLWNWSATRQEDIRDRDRSCSPRKAGWLWDSVCGAELRPGPVAEHSGVRARQGKKYYFIKEVTYLQMTHVLSLRVLILKGVKAGACEMAQTEILSQHSLIFFFPLW